MKSPTTILFGLVCVLAGCSPTAQVAPASPLPGPTGELPILDDPPVTPKCDLVKLPYYQQHRRYLAYDLNSDGTSEYFVESCAGVHSMQFVLVDTTGKSLLAKKDLESIGGDRLLILTAQHHGYRDIVCSEWSPAGVEGTRWQFNGKRYVRTRHFTYGPNAKRELVYIETVPGTAAARWYADCFGGPPSIRSR